MKSLIIGGRGLVGSALKRQLPDALAGISVETQMTGYVYMDITKYETMFKVFKNYRPDVVYMTAAVAHVDKCEGQGTDIVNVKGAITVLRLCEAFDARLVYFSSSYVFDGKKNTPYTVMDDPHPINHYGHQKVLVEDSIMESDLPFTIVRTVGVYGTERQKKNFAKQVINAIFSNKKIYVPADQYMNPILSDDLAHITIRLVNQKSNGIWHVAGDTCMTKYNFAVQIARHFDLEGLVVPLSSSEMRQPAKRPVNACLDCSNLERVGMQVPRFSSGLSFFMSQEFNG